MAEELIIDINLDDTKINETLNKISEDAQKTAKELESTFTQSINDNVDRLSESIEKASKQQDILTTVVKTSTGVITGFSFAIDRLGEQLATVFGGVTARLAGFNKGIFGLTFGLAAAGASFDILTETLKESDNEFLRFGATLTKIAGFITGGLAFALTLGITKLGEFGFAAGNRLVKNFEEAADSFIQAEREILLFNKTIDAFNVATNNAIGETAAWTSQIRQLSDELNISQVQLRKASREIVSVGSRLGLQEKQLLQLNRVVAEYAKLQGKDVFDASVAFVSALNGQSQAVTSFGVKLTEASNQQFLLKQGLDENFRSLTDAQKVQIRFNNLLSQYSTVAGLAQSASDTLAEQTNKLRINQERLNRALGEGAAIIENNNLIAFLFNTVLNGVSESVLTLLGFVGALGSRFLQVGGFLLSFSFQIIAVTKAIQLLNLALQTNIAQGLLLVRLPLLNQSLLTLISTLAGTSVAIKSVGDIIRAFALIVLNSFKQLPRVLFTFGRTLALLLLPLTPLIAKFALITAVISAFVKAVKIIEQETSLFSESLTILAEAFGFDDKINTITSLFSKLTDVIFTLSRKAVGSLVVGFASVFDLFTKIATSGIGKRIFGDTATRIQGLNSRLQSLSDRLIVAGLDFGNFGRAIAASSSNGAEALKKLEERLAAVLKQIDEATAATPQAQLAVLRETFADQQQILQEALNARLLTTDQFQKASLALTEQFKKEEERLLLESGDRQALIAKSVGENLSQLLTAGVSQGVSALGAALVKGENAFQAFGKTVLGILGDVLINIGTAIVTAGIAIDALRASLTAFFGGFAIAGGLALIALGGALKAISGGAGSIGTVGGPPGATPGAAPVPETNEPEFADTNDLERTTAVTVNVEGTIFDPIDTGRQIADLLNDAFNAGASTVQVNTA